MKTLKLRITVNDLKGDFGSNYDCSIARALKRHTGKPMNVGGLEAGFMDSDNGKTFGAFTFSCSTGDRVLHKAGGIGKRTMIIELEDHR